MCALGTRAVFITGSVTQLAQARLVSLQWQGAIPAGPRKEAWSLVQSRSLAAAGLPRHSGRSPGAHWPPLWSRQQRSSRVLTLMAAGGGGNGPGHRPKGLAGGADGGSGDAGGRQPSEGRHARKGGAAWVLWVAGAVLKVVSGAMTAAVVLVAAAPAVLSTPGGLQVGVALLNQTLSDTLEMRAAHLGWQEGVSLEGVKLSDRLGVPLLSIESISTRARLWELLLGRAGLGDATLQGVRWDLRAPEVRLAAKAQQDTGTAETKAMAAASDLMHMDVHINIPAGGLTAPGVEVVVAADLAAVCGRQVTLTADVDADSGPAARGPQPRGPPTRVRVVSECALGEAVGHYRGGKLHLLQPMLAKMELTPAVGKLFLGRLNPLLADIAGPPPEDAMPDVVMRVTPRDMAFPAEEYRLEVEPITAVLVRGSLLDGALRLVKDRASGASDLRLRTGPLAARWAEDGRVEGERLDLLVGGGVHLAAWGRMDLKRGDVNMVLALPADTCSRLLGGVELPHNYALQIPISGDVQQPSVDWYAAGVQLAELVMRHRYGLSLAPSSTPRPPLPPPIGALPWLVTR